VKLNLIEVTKNLADFMNSLPGVRKPIEIHYWRPAMDKLSAAGFSVNPETLEISFGESEGGTLAGELSRFQNSLREAAHGYRLVDISRKLEGCGGVRANNLSSWRSGSVDLSVETLIAMAPVLGLTASLYAIKPFSFTYP
jgi:hypothetical protein